MTLPWESDPSWQSPSNSSAPQAPVATPSWLDKLSPADRMALIDQVAGNQVRRGQQHNEEDMSAALLKPSQHHSFLGGVMPGLASGVLNYHSGKLAQQDIADRQAFLRDQNGIGGGPNPGAVGGAWGPQAPSEDPMAGPGAQGMHDHPSGYEPPPSVMAPRRAASHPMAAALLKQPGDLSDYSQSSQPSMDALTAGLNSLPSADSGSMAQALRGIRGARPPDYAQAAADIPLDFTGFPGPRQTMQMPEMDLSRNGSEDARQRAANLSQMAGMGPTRQKMTVPTLDLSGAQASGDEDPSGSLSALLRGRGY